MTPSSTGYTPLKLVLSRLSPHLALEQYTKPVDDAHLAREKWQPNLGEHLGRFSTMLLKSQQQYIRDFDLRLRRRREKFAIGGFSFLRMEKRSKSKTHLRHKISPVSDGSHRVNTLRKLTIGIERPNWSSERLASTAWNRLCRRLT